MQMRERIRCSHVAEGPVRKKGSKPLDPFSHLAHMNLLLGNLKHRVGP